MLLIPRRTDHPFEVAIACRRCTLSADRFRSIRAAKKAGWTKVEEWLWRTNTANHRGLCPTRACQDHPEETP